VNALLQYCRENLSNENGTNRPGIIHRLDKDTSGLMITAKTNEFHKKMAQYFSLENGKKIIKKYLCWTFGIPKQRNSQINTFLKRDRRDRQKYTVDQHDGKFSITKYNVLEIAYITSTKALSLIECELLTGRTHQIRVHMRHIGCPIVGDPTYGYGKVSQLYPDMVKTFPRTALHSHHLEFKHPITGENMLFQAELPQDLHDLNHVCFSKK
jgi:23S rRNA pseudouridine1911/1915/1917 synthase